MVEVAEEPSSKANEPPVEAKLKLGAALAVWMAPTHTANARITIAHAIYPDGLSTLPTAFLGSRNSPSWGSESEPSKLHVTVTEVAKFAHELQISSSYPTSSTRGLICGTHH